MGGTVLVGLTYSAIYAGVAVGGGLGGLALSRVAPAQLGLIGAVLTAVALTLTLAPGSADRCTTAPGLGTAR